MNELCHRCHGELPTLTPGDERGGAGRLEDVLLFCPHCSAPQILLPEHMRVETESQKAAASTGTMPPPKLDGSQEVVALESVDWRAAATSCAYVAVAGAVLTVAGLRFHAFSIMSTFWVMGAAVMALGLYTRKRPHAQMDGRVGMRIGAVTGLMLIAAMGLGLASAGVTARFAAHDMAGFDATLTQQLGIMRAQTIEKLKDQNSGAEMQARLLNFMDSAEVRAGLVVLYAGFVSCLIMLISMGGGAFSGMMRKGAAGRGVGAPPGD